MKEQTISAVLEDPKLGLDWPVSIIYEYDGGIQINGVYDDHDDADTDYVKELTPDQYTQVELACIDDYESLCSAAEAAPIPWYQYRIAEQAAKNKTHMEFMEATMNETGNLLDQSQIELARFREATRAIISDQTTPDSDGDVMVNGELINALANAMQPAKEDS